jgi:hypothetical protein
MREGLRGGPRKGGPDPTPQRRLPSKPGSTRLSLERAAPHLRYPTVRSGDADCAARACGPVHEHAVPGALFLGRFSGLRRLSTSIASRLHGLSQGVRAPVGLLASGVRADEGIVGSENSVPQAQRATLRCTTA